MRTAPSGGWISLGLALGAGAAGSERMVAAHRAVAARDDAFAGMREATTAAELDALRQEVIDQEDRRNLAQTIGLSAIGTASALAVWALVEWVWAEPELGRLEGPGIEAVLHGGAP